VNAVELRKESPERLASILRDLAVEHKAKLDELKSKAADLERDDAVWHLLLQSFSTLGGSRGWEGLIGNPANYRQVTFEAIKKCAASRRLQQVEETLLAAKVRYPKRKAEHLVVNFALVEGMGGPVEARRQLLDQPGREGKMAFLKRFKGIGNKYARNILMDVYHPDFRNSIALDSRVRGISSALGLEFSNDQEHEEYYLGVAKKAGLNGWEVDRLLYNFRDKVLLRLGRLLPARSKS